MRKKLYFGHPINVYGTELQKMLLEKIAARFPEYEVENPDQKHHDAKYREHGMSYFFEKVLPDCSAGVFLPFRDGAFGKGVFGEAKFLADHERPIYQITAEGIITPIQISEMISLTKDETRTRIRTANKKILP